MEVLIQATQLILSLSILVILHELGHFIPAKLFKTKVEKFYLFFDPWFSLFKTKKGETEYGIGWLPLGGYVKIAGMIDESMDKEQMKQPPQPWEFRSKPAWQRLIIMIGGVTVNVILGFVIYSFVLFTWGESYVPNSSLENGVYADPVAQNMGFQSGDKILRVNGEEIEKFRDVQKKIILNDQREVEILRNGEKKSISIQSADMKEFINKQKPLFAIPISPVVDSILLGKAADLAGLKKGDSIVSVNGTPTPFFQDVQQIVGENKGETININVIRDGDTIAVEPKVSERGTIGFIALQEADIQVKYEKYGLIDAIPAGISKTYTSLVDYIDQIKLIGDTETEAYKSLGGFITIGKAYSPEWDWQRFWNFTAFLSIILAIMNILPIPALDGGHVMFLIYEIITGRKPHDKVLEYAQIAGIIILLSLMLLANGNDIMKLFQ